MILDVVFNHTAEGGNVGTSYHLFIFDFVTDLSISWSSSGRKRNATGANKTSSTAGASAERQKQGTEVTEEGK